ncbi:MAG: hypothetical protein ABJE95_33215 [Byssovorax sp.]
MSAIPTIRETVAVTSFAGRNVPRPPTVTFGTAPAGSGVVCAVLGGEGMAGLAVLTGSRVVCSGAFSSGVHPSAATAITEQMIVIRMVSVLDSSVRNSRTLRGGEREPSRSTAWCDLRSGLTESQKRAKDVRICLTAAITRRKGIWRSPRLPASHQGLSQLSAPRRAITVERGHRIACVRRMKTPSRVPAAPRASQWRSRPWARGPVALHTLRKVALWSLATCLGAEALYVVAANLALGPLLADAARGAGVTLEYASAYTVIPGRVRMSEIHIADPGVGVRISAARARISLHLSDLFRRKPHLAELHATGVRVALGAPFVAVARVDPPGALIAAGFIAGGSDERAREPAMPHVRIDAFDATVDAVTFPAAAIDGTIRVAGEALAMTEAGLTMGRGSIDLTHGSLSASGATLAEELHGHIDAAIAPVSVAGEPRDTLARTTGRLDVEGDVVAIGGIMRLAPIPARGRITVTSTLAYGVLGDASHASLDLDRVTLTVFGRRLALEDGLRATLGVAAAPQGAEPRMAARVVGRVEAKNATLSGEDEEGEATALEDVAVTVGTADTQEARDLHVSASRARVNVGGASLTAAISASGCLERLDAGVGRIRGGEVEARELVISSEGVDTAPLDARFSHGAVKLGADIGVIADGHLHARGGTLKAFLDLAGAPPAMHLAVSALEEQPIELDADLARGPARLALEGVVLRSGALSARGAYASAGGRTHAAFVVSYGGLEVGLDRADGRTESRINPPDGWLTAHAP